MQRHPISYVILGLLLVCSTALAERKIHLEDIERDNLRAESKSSDDTSLGVTDKSVTGQTDYQQSGRYQSEERSSGYAGPQRVQDKYTVHPNDYERDVKYSENDVRYQKTEQPVRQYNEYHHHQQQVETEEPKGDTPDSVYESPQELYYQQEVIVGNQFQAVRQKEATQKYKSLNKDSKYVDVPMSQLLAYYPNLSLSPNQRSISKSEIQPLLHRLASAAARLVTIPVYTPYYNRDPIYSPSRVAYQIQPQYSPPSSKYPQHTEAILPSKQTNELIYSQSVPSHQRQQHQPPVSQPQRYLQEIVYTQPGVVYAPEVSSSHADVHAPPSVYLRGNGPSSSYASQSRHQQRYSPYVQPETYYSLHAANYAPQLTANQIYQQQQPQQAHQSGENGLHDYEEIPESPGSGLDLPRLPAQNFKSDATLRLLPVSSESEDSQYNHLDDSSEPRSLLDSYVPSRLIAAQDSERYKERPIRLERGFLPSKVNFVQTHKKRSV